MARPSTMPTWQARAVPRLGPSAAALLILWGVAADSVAARRGSPRIARDFHEIVVEGFEQPADGNRMADDRRVTLVKDSPKATRGRGCLKISPAPPDDVVVRFILSADDLDDHDWLEYDLIGAVPGAVLIETTLRGDERNQPLARTATVVEDAKWVGQLLLPELVGGNANGPLHVEFRFTALGPKSELYFDSLRVVRDNPPKLPKDAGGCYCFGSETQTAWPGFEIVDAEPIRLGEGQWTWEGRLPPQISRMEWPDPIMREMVSAGPSTAREMEFSLLLQLRPGRYSGVVLASPIMRHGLSRAGFALDCNGQEVIDHDWAPERMFSQDGIFAGRDLRDFGADSVRRVWADESFLSLPFRADARDGIIALDSTGMSLCGLVVYPKSHRKKFKEYVESLRTRRARYFAQQVYACVHPMLPEPPDSPTEDENKSGLQVLSVSPLKLLSPEFSPGAEHLVRDRIELFGLTDQTITTAIGVLALDDLRDLRVSTKRSRSGRGRARVSAIREFPTMWRHETRLRRAVPFWLSPSDRRGLQRGRLAWYLVAIDIPGSQRSKELKVGLRVSSSKRPTSTVEVAVAVAASLGERERACRGVLYPRESESGYLLSLIGPTPWADVGALVLEDYRVLRQYGLTATVIHGIHLDGDTRNPRAMCQRALARARIAERGGMCDQAMGWIDFSGIANSRQWLTGPDQVVVDVVGNACRQLRSDLGEIGIRGTALLATNLTVGKKSNQAGPDDLLDLARLLRQTGWRSAGVAIGEAGLQGPDARKAQLDDLVRLAGKFDRVMAPDGLTAELRRRWPRLRIETITPSADRFSSGLRLWLGSLDGVWTSHVHRRTLPYMPLDAMRADERPLLMPFPERPSPTLRLLALREGANDLDFVDTLSYLLKSRRSNRGGVDKAKLAMDRIQETLTKAWQEARDQADFAQGPDAGDSSQVMDRLPVPSNELLDECRRELFDRITSLSRRK